MSSSLLDLAAISGENTPSAVNVRLSPQASGIYAIFFFTWREAEKLEIPQHTSTYAN